MKKFDFCIGNPPYQEETVGEQKQFAPPVYDKFLEAAYNIADKVEMIHPSRFLFNAGSTSKAWNEKMLNDPHVKILFHEQKSSNVFSGTDIKGGVSISYRDVTRQYTPIGVFTQFEELNSVLNKITTHIGYKSLENICLSRTAYKITPLLHKENPEAIKSLSNGHPYDMSTNIFERLPKLFYDKPLQDGYDYAKILGRLNNERIYKYIRREYINNVSNFEKYKVFVATANGCGAIGETLSTPIIGTPIIGTPKTGCTESFMGIGCFDYENEAFSTMKYIKTKFARCLLGVLKTTQHITPEKWKYVPLQNFTSASDIDWSLSMPDIDQQLYKKYGLSSEEVNFIETHIKAME